MNSTFWVSAKYFFTVAAVFVSGHLVSFVFRAPVPSDWWSPLSAIATAAAVFVALWTYGRQRADAAVNKLMEEAAVILGLQQLAKEVASMCILTAYQTDHESNPIIYPDIPMECQTLADMLSRLPLDVVSAHGHMSALLHLRRIAIELAMIWGKDPKRDGSTYRMNRNRLHALDAEASHESIELASYLKQLAPGLYLKNKELIERL